jgi:hypothetical protein
MPDETMTQDVQQVPVGGAKGVDYHVAEAKKAFAARDEARATAKQIAAERDALAQRVSEFEAIKSAHDELATKYADAVPRLEAHERMQSYLVEQVESALKSIPEDLAKTIPAALDPIERLRLVEGIRAHTQKSAHTMPPAYQQTTASVDVLSIADPVSRREAIRNMSRADKAELLKRLGGAR